MTQEKMYDMLHQQFPEIRETEAEQRLNAAVDEFSERTMIFHSTVNITTVASQTEYTINANIIRIDSVIQGSTVFTQIARRPENYTGGGTESVYYLQGDTIHLGTLGTRTLGALDAGLTVKLHCRAKPDTLGQYVALLDSSGDAVVDLNGDPIYVVASELTGGPDIPRQFHVAVVYRVLSDLYLITPKFSPRERIAMSREYERKYNRIVRDAASYANRNHSGEGFNIQPHLY
jgi:hypothetical protein